MTVNWKKYIPDFILAGAIVLLVVLASVFSAYNPMGYRIYLNDTIHYDKGVVTQINDESLEPQEDDPSRILGVQDISVEMKNGQFQGQTIRFENSLSTTHNVQVKEGQDIVVKVDSPEGVEPFFTVYNYDRTFGVGLILLLFIGLMVLVGRAKGMRSVIGLLFSLFLIGVFLLPAIYQGYSPVLCGIAVAVAITVICQMLLNGISAKTKVAVLASIIGILLSTCLFFLFTSILRLNGYNLDETEELLLISQSTGLQIGPILFVGVLISSLGAVMDMTMSIATSLFEMKQLHPNLSQKQIVSSGMNIGKDMIGTMCETLILAFAGGAITTLLVIVSYGAQFGQMLNSDYIAIEIVQSITGSCAVVLSVPLTSLFSAWLFHGDKATAK